MPQQTHQNPDFLELLKAQLKAQFKLENFRAGQSEIITSILQKKDVLAVLPTGGGKSLCFQFPAAHLQELVVVVSPLIALMRDQVLTLERMGIPAGAIHSGQDETEKRGVFDRMRKGGPFILYLSPERVQKEAFQRWVQNKKIALFAIDEAHCVSQWGHDFREDYSKVGILKKLRPDVPTLALTASATPAVLVDIAKQLQLRDPEQKVYGFYRPNLYYQVEYCQDEEIKNKLLRQALNQTPQGRIIIYCGTRNTTEKVAHLVQRESTSVAYYHAGLSPEQRTKTQEAYARGELRILVATNAFGMGIDQADVRLVVHYQMPSTIDSLYQEMGRAGRDGEDSTCLMLYSPKDKGLQSYFIQNSDAPKNIKTARWKNLDALINYAEGGECRHAEILTYYKDTQRISACGHCDTCLPESPRRIDKTLAESLSSKLPRAKPGASGFAKFEDSAADSVTGASSAKLRKKNKKNSSSANQGPVLDRIQEERFQKLKSWRKQKSVEMDTPAFIIFSDRTLKDIAIKAPQSLDQLRSVYGLGEEKLTKFGAELINILS